MDNGQFSVEWDKLKEDGLQLFDQVKRLKLKLASLPQDPAMNKLLVEKRELKTRVTELGNSISLYITDNNNCLKNEKRVLVRRRFASTDTKTQQEIDVQLQKRRDRLARLEAIQAPEAIVRYEKNMILELESPIEEVEFLYKQLADERRRKIDELHKALQEMQEQISAIDRHYRETQLCLERAIHETELKVRDHHAHKIEWATQSRSHLEWVLKEEPSFTSSIVRRYKERFPTDDLVDLFSPSSISTPVQERGIRKRSKVQAKPHTHPCSAAKSPETSIPWRFWVTFKEGEVGQELAFEKEKFLAGLRTAMEQEAYPSLPIEKVYEQLKAVSEMEATQRQQIKKIKYGTEMLGWKIVRANREHRLFLSIDEENRRIRFLPRQRRDSYKY